MDGSGYRSYLLRAWRRPVNGRSVRVHVEEIQSGREADLRGEEAAALGDAIAAALPSPAVGVTNRGEGGRSMILVIGATGLLGGQIAHGLLARGEQVRILVRDGSDHGRLLAAGAQPVRGDLRDPASLRHACEGVDTIVTTAISIGGRGGGTVESVEDAGYASLIEAAHDAGVQQFVYTSMLDADAQSPVPFVAAKARTEQRLVESGMAWTILSPGPFMDVWLGAVVAGPALEGREVVYVGRGVTPHSFVHSRDVAAFACTAVGTPAARNRRILIGGPEALSLRGAVAVFEEVLGHPIPQRGVGPADPVPGLPPAMAGMLVMLERPETIVDPRDLADEFGVEQTSVRQWARSMLPVPVS